MPAGSRGLVGRVAMRSLHRLQRRQALPPGVESDPVIIVVFIASRSCLAHFNGIDRMDFPYRRAYRAAGLIAWAGRMRSVKEQLAGHTVGVCLEPRRHAGIAGVFLGLGVPGFKVADLVPGSRTE